MKEEEKQEIKQIKQEINGTPKHIQEYIKESRENTFLDLFEADRDNIDLRTDLNIQEILALVKLKIDNDFLNDKLPGLNLYTSLIEFYSRHKVSFNRLSRGEFVDINRKDFFSEKNAQRLGAFKQLTEVKQ